MVSYPSISGIMMSISTIATSGVDSRVAIASRPGPSGQNRHSAPFQHAAEREDVAHVVIHDQHLLSHQSVVGTMQPVQHFLLLRRQIGDHAMQEQRSLIEQPFGRLHAFDDHAARQRVQASIFFR